MRAFTTVLVLAAYWGIPIAMMLTNRLHPSVGNALGVPYGFLFGFVLGLVATIAVAIATNWFSNIRPYYLVLFTSALLTFFLFLLADRGLLSVFP